MNSPIFQAIAEQLCDCHWACSHYLQQLCKGSFHPRGVETKVRGPYFRCLLEGSHRPGTQLAAKDTNQRWALPSKSTLLNMETKQQQVPLYQPPAYRATIVLSASH